MTNNRATAKNAKSIRQKKFGMLLSSTTLAASSFLAMAAHPAHALDSKAVPTNGLVVGGQANITNPSKGQENIYQKSDRVIIDWDSYSIGTNAGVQYYQPGKGSIAVNKVTGADPSQILGTLTSNGIVMILNRNGVLFGKNATINVGGIVASTGDIDNASFMTGSSKIQFTNFGTGSVDNEGTINVADAGLAAFVSPTIVNNGIINARLGRVGFGAGSTVTLDLYGDNLITIAVDAKHAAALIKQNGTINAEGGTVMISAQAAKQAVDEVINMSGVIDVSSATVKDGTIILAGGAQGTVNVSGKLNAGNGGSVQISGQNVDAQSGFNFKGKTVGITADNTAALDGGKVTGDLTVQGSTVNFTQDLILDNGTLTVNAIASGIQPQIVSSNSSGTINLNGKIYSDDAETTLLAASSISGTASTVNVLSNGGSINQGIDLIGSNGGTVKVAAGTYDEDVVLNKANVILDGAQAGVGGTAKGRGTGGETIITPHSPGIDVTANNDTVDGFTINGASNGVLVQNASGAVIKDNIINNSTGNSIYLTNSTGATVSNNLVENGGSTAHGIAFEQGSNNGTATGNTVNNVGYNGIYSANSTGMTFDGNTVTNAAQNSSVLAHGISIDNGSGTISNNTVTNSGGDGIMLDGATAPSFVTGNTVTGTHADGIDIENSAKATVNKNIIYQTGADGIYALVSDNLVIDGNTIGANKLDVTQGANNIDGSGIFVVNSQNLKLGDGTKGNANKVYNTGWDGISLWGTGNALVSGNIVNTTARVGIYGNGMIDSTITGNTVSNMQLAGAGAIGMTSGSDLTITGNNVSASNGSGIQLNNVGGVNSVTGNNIDGVAANGIDAEGTSNLTISNNQIGQNIAGAGVIGNDGIYVDPVKTLGTVISGNTITGGVNGIDLEGDSNITVGGKKAGDVNTITGASNDGILVNGGGSNNVLNNTVKNSGHDGIEIVNSSDTVVGSDKLATGNRVDSSGFDDISTQGGDGVQITYNTITNALGASGIAIHSTTNAVVDHNKITGTNLLGVYAQYADGIQISNNTIKNTGLAYSSYNSYGTGIGVEGTNGVTITGNSIDGATGDGINAGYTINLSPALDTNVTIDGNTVNNVTGDGIKGASGIVSVSGNTVSGTGENGIEVANSDGARIKNNQITSAGIDGINVSDSDSVLIKDNTITGGDGFFGITYDPITEQFIFTQTNGANGAGRDGIHIENVTNATVDGNKIYGGVGFLNTGGLGAGRYGIYADKDNGIVIENNEIQGAGQFYGLEGIVIILGNPAAATGNDGIFLADSKNANVSNNTISDVGQNGIKISGGKNNTVSDNNIDSISNDGVLATGSDNITVTDNNIGANSVAGGIIGGDGIDVKNAKVSDISNNNIAQAILNGIQLDNVINTEVDNNKIGLNSAIGKNGIKVDNSNGVKIKHNQITAVGIDGINVADSDSILVKDNTIIGGEGEEQFSYDPITQQFILINTNNDDGANRDGIHIENVTNAKIDGNTIKGGTEFLDSGLDGAGAGRYGIYADKDTNIVIENNNIKGMNSFFGLGGAGSIGDAIFVKNSDGAKIEDNKISGTGTLGSSAGGDGIILVDSKNATITANSISDVGNNGIEVENSDSAIITNNNISNTGADGIYVDPTSNEEISYNKITGAGQDGIFVKGGKNAVIDHNTIEGGVGFFGGTGTDGAGRDGIHINDVTNATLDGNNIIGGYGVFGGTGGIGAGRDGIYADNSAGILIENNKIDGGTGFFGYGGASVGDNGIFVKNSKGATIESNQIVAGLNSEIGDGGASAGRNGIKLVDSDKATISANTINGVGANGVEVDGGKNALITGNFIDGVNDDGVFTNGADNVTITDNYIGEHLAGSGKIGGDGIDVENSHGGEISGNQIAHVETDGIALVNVKGDSETAFSVLKNTIDHIGDDGIHAVSVDNVSIANNDIDHVGSNGIEVDGAPIMFATLSFASLSPDAPLAFAPLKNSKDVTITGNTIKNAKADGIVAKTTDDLTVSDNKINKIGNDGIVLDTVSNAKVLSNKINNTAANGIVVENSHHILIDSNKIGLDGTIGGDGILVTTYSDIKTPKFPDFNSQGAPNTDITITNNKIANAAFDGVHVENTKNLTVSSNDIDDVGSNGVELDGVANAEVAYNRIGLNGFIGGNGIAVYGEEEFFGLSLLAPISNGGSSHDITIDHNKIANTGDDGIHVENTDKLKVYKNNIGETEGDGFYGFNITDAKINHNKITDAGSDGIAVYDSNNVKINKNIISKSGEATYSTGNDGIYLEDSSNLVVKGNTIGNTAADGIDGFNLGDATIDGNTINNSGDDGISTDLVTGLNVRGNTINTAGNDGIKLQTITDAKVLSNIIDNTFNNGIEVANSTNILVDSNKIGTRGFIDGDGILVTADTGTVGLIIDPPFGKLLAPIGIVDTPGSSTLITITNNTVGNAALDGIHVEDTKTLTVDSNTVSHTGKDGINLIRVTNAEAVANIINNVGTNGIEAADSSNLSIDNNQIGLTGSIGGDGILGNGITGLTISGNTINGATTNGVEVSDSDTVQLLNNLITNSGSNGFFASGGSNGSIVLTGNTFTDNQTGARFQSGAIDLTGTGANANTFNGGTLGMVFDPGVGGDASALTLVDLTIGGSVFNGQSSYYIELANNAFFAPGRPTILDGTQASYDGFKPQSVPFLTLDEYNQLEAKIYDYNDNATLGEFFFGVVPDIDQSDIFRKIAGYRVGGRGFNVTIRSLPNVTGGQGGTSAAALANLQPAAGGDNNGGGQTNNAQQAAGIEPSAGGNGNGNQKTSNVAVGRMLRRALAAASARPSTSAARWNRKSARLAVAKAAASNR